VKNICLINVGEFDDLISSIYKKYEQDLNKFYIIDNSDYFYKFKEKFKNLKFIDFHLNSRLQKNDIDECNFELNNQTISFYTKYYLDFDEICNRYDFKNNFLPNQRLIHFYHLLAFYENFLKKNKISLAIFNHTPHHINSFCLYLVCKYYKVAVKINTQFSFGSEIRFTIDQNIYDRAEKIKNNIKNTSLDLNIVSKYIKSNFNYEIPDYMKPRTGKKLRLLNLNYQSLGYLLFRDLKEAIKCGLFKKSKYYLKINKKKFFFEEENFSNIKSIILRTLQRFKILSLKNYYKKNCSTIDQIKEKKYCVFYPNYQPEATTSPSASFYSNIFLIIETIQSIIGKDYIILYKEHPSTFNYDFESFFKRNQDLYKSLQKRFNKLRFVDINFSNNDLFNLSDVIFTQTSNVALEGLRNSKPAIIFGNSWFDSYYNIHKFENMTDAKKYIADFKFNSQKFNEELSNYASSVLENSFQLNFKTEKDQENLIKLI
jgi:hypothetical protein